MAWSAPIGSLPEPLSVADGNQAFGRSVDSRVIRCNGYSSGFGGHRRDPRHPDGPRQVVTASLVQRRAAAADVSTSPVELQRKKR